jgi:hypothetical protein
MKAMVWYYKLHFFGIVINIFSIILKFHVRLSKGYKLDKKSFKW